MREESGRLEREVRGSNMERGKSRTGKIRQVSFNIVCPVQAIHCQRTERGKEGFKESIGIQMIVEMV